MFRNRILSLSLVASLLAGPVVAGPHEDRPKPERRPHRIEWTPSAIRQIVERGQTYTFSASFTSARALENVQLRLTPSLARHVTLDVSSFATVPANTPTTIQITLVVPPAPADPMLPMRDSYGGNLQLRADGRHLEKPLKLHFHVPDPTPEPQDDDTPAGERHRH